MRYYTKKVPDGFLLSLGVGEEDMFIGREDRLYEPIARLAFYEESYKIVGTESKEEDEPADEYAEWLANEDTRIRKDVKEHPEKYSEEEIEYYSGSYSNISEEEYMELIS